jgi:biotin synthase
MKLTPEKIRYWLGETDEVRLGQLWYSADLIRRRNVGDAVHLRGLIELSNCCDRKCLYCGLREPNRRLERYRMPHDEVIECVQEAARLQFGTVVLQSGEDAEFDLAGTCDLIRRIKGEADLAVTLSLGERNEDELKALRAAGADRYLLRFETSNRALFDRIHPPLHNDQPSDRIGQLRRMRELGFEVGSGVMVGIPGQTREDLVNDLQLFEELDLDMIGIGPYISHPHTPLLAFEQQFNADPAEQVAADELTTYKMLAMSRLMCPRANIPATTALATINKASGRENGLRRGANVIMPNLTPTKYRESYEIYPDKACVGETATACRSCVEIRIRRIGRTVAKGRGDSPNVMARRGDTPAIAE